ncbi:MAG TPA: carbohydrate ABC transporter permease [Chloroflexota bacterium]|nr:carbohydrate ABC transporter permease [Chloroflexota bacterium]
MTAAAPDAPQTVSWYRTQSGAELLQRVATLAILSILALAFIVPVIWMVISSLKPIQTVFDNSWLPPMTSQGWPVPIPHPQYFSNFSDAMTLVPFGTYFKNTLIVTVFSVAGSVLSSSLVAYSFARLRWPGRDFFFVLVLATMLLPGIVTFIPQFIIFSKIGWVDTFLPLIVPTWFGNAFYIFLLRQFYRGIPQELAEAARIDGAGEFRIWWQIVMPLARPALAAVGIFAFTGAWEDYFGPLIYVGGDPNNWTLQLGLKAFETAAGGGSPLWNLIMAAGLVVMIPVLVAFFIGQKYFIEGVTLTGLKG